MAFTTSFSHFKIQYLEFMYPKLCIKIKMCCLTLAVANSRCRYSRSNYDSDSYYKGTHRYGPLSWQLPQALPTGYSTVVVTRVPRKCAHNASAPAVNVRLLTDVDDDI